MRLSACDPGTGRPLTVTVEVGTIGTIEPASVAPHCWIAPALIDIQVNGYGGFDFNAAEPTPETVVAAIVALREAGVSLCCPTIATGSFHEQGLRLRAIADACDQDAAVARSVACIHLEGPYLSPHDGPRGTHPLAHIRPPDWDEFQRLQEAARGLIGLVTLAPELPGAVPLIERLTEQGVLVALGHHAAGPGEIDAAVRAGARMCTHLGNGAHAQLPRHPNYIWEQLGDDRLAASFIVDGHHLAPSVVRCMLRAKGIARSILISDAIFLAGLLPGNASFLGLPVELTPERRINLAGTPYLAGSALALSEGIGHVVAFGGATLAEAVQMATANPAALLGKADHWGTIAPGRDADLVLFSWDGQMPLRVEALLARGAVVWGKVPE